MESKAARREEIEKKVAEARAAQREAERRVKFDEQATEETARQQKVICLAACQGLGNNFDF